MRLDHDLFHTHVCPEARIVDRDWVNGKQACNVEKAGSLSKLRSNSLRIYQGTRDRQHHSSAHMPGQLRPLAARERETADKYQKALHTSGTQEEGVGDIVCPRQESGACLLGTATGCKVSHPGLVSVLHCCPEGMRTGQLLLPATASQALVSWQG